MKLIAVPPASSSSLSSSLQGSSSAATKAKKGRKGKPKQKLTKGGIGRKQKPLGPTGVNDAAARWKDGTIAGRDAFVVAGSGESGRSRPSTPTTPTQQQQQQQPSSSSFMSSSSSSASLSASTQTRRVDVAKRAALSDGSIVSALPSITSIGSSSLGMVGKTSIITSSSLDKKENGVNLARIHPLVHARAHARMHLLLLLFVLVYSCCGNLPSD